MKYFLRLSTLLLGIALGASAVFLFQHIRALADAPQTAERVTSKPVQRSADSITEITLERTGCFGLCPAYKVILRRDETAAYVGEASAKRKGMYKGKIYDDFYHLTDLIELHGYVDLKSGDQSLDCVESPHVITTFLFSNGRRKTIDIDTCTYKEEAKLWELWAAIDGAAANIDWQPDK